MIILKAYIDNDDCVATIRQAHKIKGAISNIGAVTLCEMLQKIEDTGKSENTLALRKLYQDMIPEYAGVIKCLTTNSQR